MFYFLLGFPGFITTRIVRKLAEDDPSQLFILLVHPSQLDKARNTVRAIAEATGSPADRFRIIEGDITRPSLGLTPSEQTELAEQITKVFHFAAIYDLAVGEDIAELINVRGTENVVNWVGRLPNLERFIYCSTAYVSGRRRGTVLESELIDINGFKNHYESTKFKAELAVQRAWDAIPTTIVRPGVVMGDSRTGETDKFDGPYFVMRFLDRFSKIPIPNLGRGDVLFNVVPVDFVVDAICHLANLKEAEHHVYHLVDPSPHSVRDAFALICQAQMGFTPRYTIPLPLVRVALSIPPLRRWVGVEQETLDYFKIGPIYDSYQAQKDLAAIGITCPDFASYIQKAVEYFIEHKSDLDKRIRVT